MNEDLTIIDLISEKHIVLRREFEDRWRENEEEDISHTEAFLLGKLSRGRISIAEAARIANISRQAMFKCAKKLEERGYIENSYDENNSKYLKLTSKGQDYFYRSEKIKREIEDEISNCIGKDKFRKMKKILQSSWIK
ncbi:MAG: winged helix-turn-helix transcriptional regulator [Clostridium sp.]|nr:winged helix-turn-helix transcriptional regulator [Clostridium sp.]